MTAVVAEAYVLGVSTRRVEDLVQAMGVAGISRSQVSELARSLDGIVEAFRNRPLDGGPYPYVRSWVTRPIFLVDGGKANIITAVEITGACEAEGQAVGGMLDKHRMTLDAFKSEASARRPPSP
jgi:hypothetical protein